MKYYFIINPAAGAVSANRFLLPKINEYFAGTDKEFKIYITERKGHDTELARQIAESGEEARIIACGGDGTLNGVITGAFNYPNVEFGIIPCGSGNDFIKCFGSKDDFTIDLAVSGKPVPVDLIRINDSICCVNIVSIGIDADVAAGVSKWRRVPFCGGHAAYNLSLIECLLKPIGWTFSVNGETKNLTIITACNGRVYGGGYNAAPEADLNDGLMDVVQIRKISKFQLAKIIGLYKEGKHVQNGVVPDNLKDFLSFSRTDEIEIMSDSEFITNIDGETEWMKEARIKIIHVGFRFIAP